VGATPSPFQDLWLSAGQRHQCLLSVCLYSTNVQLYEQSCEGLAEKAVESCACQGPMTRPLVMPGNDTYLTRMCQVQSWAFHTSTVLAAVLRDTVSPQSRDLTESGDLVTVPWCPRTLL
jgi:hypothetical protein